MITEKREKQILTMSFISGLIFAIIEFIFSIYSDSQSALTDAVYDASELVFIALLLFLTPLFHKPVSEKHPYGYFQIESIFVIIKSVMMLSVTIGVLVEILKSALAGGNMVNNAQIAIFQFCLGSGSIFIYLLMRKLNKNLSSPTINAELLGWKLDIIYSFGMSLTFFISLYLKHTSLAWISPYVDSMIAVMVMLFVLPESAKVLWEAIKNVFLFSPEKAWVEEIKEVCNPILEEYHFLPLFYDITKTGRHLWIAVYFQIEEECLNVNELQKAWKAVNEQVQKSYQECTCELILMPKTMDIG